MTRVIVVKGNFNELRVWKRFFGIKKKSSKENELVFNYSYIGDKAGMCFHPNKLGETFVDLSVLKDPSFFILPPPPPWDV